MGSGEEGAKEGGHPGETGTGGREGQQEWTGKVGTMEREGGLERERGKVRLMEVLRERRESARGYGLTWGASKQAEGKVKLDEDAVGKKEARGARKGGWRWGAGEGEQERDAGDGP